MNKVIHFPTGTNLTVSQGRALQLVETARQRQQEKEERLKEEGSVVWQQLNNRRRPKLTLNDRTRMAKNLHECIQQNGLKNRDLAKAAGFEYGTKEIYRLTLPKATDPKKRGLRADKINYVKLIKAIHDLTGKDKNLLAEAAAFGTSLHREGIKDLSREERILLLLQSWADKVGKEHRLLECYQITAQARLERLRRGGRLRWPNFRSLEHGMKPDAADLDPQYVYWHGDHLEHREFKADSNIYWHEFIPYIPHAFVGFRSTARYPSTYDDAYYFPSAALSARLIDKSQPYDPEDDISWEHEVSRYVLNAVETPLRIDWDFTSSAPRPVLANSQDLLSLETALRQARSAYFADVWETLMAWGVDLSDHIFEQEYSSIFDGKIAKRAFLKLKSAYQERIGNPVVLKDYVHHFEDGNFMSSYEYYQDYNRHIPPMYWLIIYPNEQCDRLIPVMAQMSVEDSQVLWLKPLRSVRDLDDFEYEEITCCDDQGDEALPTLWQRVETLVAEQAILPEWQRTAPFLQYNPVLREKAREDEKDRAIDTALDNFFQEPLGG